MCNLEDKDNALKALWSGCIMGSVVSILFLETDHNLI